MNWMRVSYLKADIAWICLNIAEKKMNEANSSTQPNHILILLLEFFFFNNKNTKKNFFIGVLNPFSYNFLFAMHTIIRISEWHNQNKQKTLVFYSTFAWLQNNIGIRRFFFRCFFSFIFCLCIKFMVFERKFETKKRRCNKYLNA